MSPPDTKPARKSEAAFRTIGEVSTALGIPQHVLRYWETRFPQVKPLQRAGNRRYYRPDDIALLRRIQHLLEQEGYSIRGVQQVLAERSEFAETSPSPPVAALPAPVRTELAVIRDLLVRSLHGDAAQGI